MKNNLLLSLMVLLSFTLVSCAFTVHKTPLNYQYSGESPDVISNTNKTVFLGDFTDTRGTTTPNMIMNMRNLHGNVTTGGWEAEKPIAEVVKQAIGEGLGKIQIVRTSNSDLVLTGEVMKFSLDTITNSGLSTKYKGVLLTRIQLTDIETNKIIFRDTYTGKGDPDDGKKDNNELIKAIFTKALDNLVEEIIGDQYFLQQFN